MQLFNFKQVNTISLYPRCCRRRIETNKNETKTAAVGFVVAACEFEEHTVKNAPYVILRLLENIYLVI